MFYRLKVTGQRATWVKAPATKRGNSIIFREVDREDSMINGIVITSKKGIEKLEPYDRPHYLKYLELKVKKR